MKPPSLRTSVLVGLVSAALAACTSLLGDFHTGVEAADGGGGDGSSGGDASGGDDGSSDAGGSYTIVKPPTFELVRGTTATLGIDITRTGFAGDVSVTLTNLPSSVAYVAPSKSPAVLSQGATHASFVLTAPANAPLSSGTATIVTSAAGQSDKNLTFNFLVADPPGSLDLTFGGVGVKALAGAQADGVAVENDGSVVVAGSLQGGGDLLKRYTVVGDDDMPFNTSVAALLRGAPARLYGVTTRVLVPANPQVVVVGKNESSRVFVAVFNHDGSLDATFNGGGVFESPGGTNEAHGVVVDSKGRIVMVGADVASPGPLGRRFETTGTSTVLTYPAVPAAFSTYAIIPHAVAIGGADDIWIGGSLESGTGDERGFLVHLDATCKPDTSFGTGGILVLGTGPTAQMMSTGHFAGGATVIGGRNDTRNLLGIFTGNGQPTFDTDGGLLAIGHGTPYDYGFRTATVTADDRVILAGGRGSATKEHPFYERRFSDGGLDPITDAGLVDYLNGGALQSASEWHAADTTPAGRIVLAGIDDSGWIVARYWP